MSGQNVGDGKLQVVGLFSNIYFGLLETTVFSEHEQCYQRLP